MNDYNDNFRYVTRKSALSGRELLLVAAKEGQIEYLEIGQGPVGEGLRRVLNRRARELPLVILIDIAHPQFDENFHPQLSRYLSTETVEVLFVNSIADGDEFSRNVEPRHAQWAIQAVEAGACAVAIVLGNKAEWLYEGGSYDESRWQEDEPEMGEPS